MSFESPPELNNEEKTSPEKAEEAVVAENTEKTELPAEEVKEEITPEEKEKLIKEEKEKILQEKIDALFREFEKLDPGELEIIFQSGKTSEGGNVESKSMGPLDPEVAQALAKAYRLGIKLLPKILEVLPELLKKFDEELTKEAAERVDKKLEEEKQKAENERKKEEAPEKPYEKISTATATPEESTSTRKDEQISGLSPR